MNKRERLMNPRYTSVKGETIPEFYQRCVGAEPEDLTKEEQYLLALSYRNDCRAICDANMKQLARQVANVLYPYKTMMDNVNQDTKSWYDIPDLSHDQEEGIKKLFSNQWFIKDIASFL